MLQYGLNGFYLTFFTAVLYRGDDLLSGSASTNHHDWLTPLMHIANIE